MKLENAILENILKRLPFPGGVISEKIELAQDFVLHGPDSLHFYDGYIYEELQDARKDGYVSMKFTFIFEKDTDSTDTNGWRHIETILIKQKPDKS